MGRRALIFLRRCCENSTGEMSSANRSGSKYNLVSNNQEQKDQVFIAMSFINKLVVIEYVV